MSDTITCLEDAGGGGGIAPYTNFNTRRRLVVNTETWLLCLQEGYAVLIVQEAGLALGLGRPVQKILHSPRFEPWTIRPVASCYTNSAVLSAICVYSSCFHSVIYRISCVDH